MAIDLLSYQGNAGLGAGANGGIAVPETVDLNNINSAVRDIMLQDNQNNVLKWRQGIDDRNKLFQLIQNGKTAAGDILQEYRPNFDRAQKRVTDYFQSEGANLIKDPTKMAKYQDLMTDLNNVSAHAQTNTVQINKLKQEKANATLKEDQDRIQQHIDKQLGNTTSKFWNSVDPYQKLNSFSIDAITKVPELRKSVDRDPNNPLYTYDTSYADYDDILRYKQNQYINDKTGEDADSIDQFYNKMQDYDPIALGKALSGIDNRIVEYNKARGFKQGQVGYVEPVKRVVADNGQLLIQEPKADFAAKYALANLPSYKTSTPKFNKDEATYLVAKERANSDALYKRIMASNTGARTKAYVDNVKSQIAARTKPEEQTQFMEEMYDRTLLNQDSLVEPVSKLIPGSKGEISFSNIDANGSLPVVTLNGNKVERLKPIGAKDVLTNGKVTGYTGGHYEPIYKVGGKTYSPKQITADYNKFKDKVGKEWTGTIDDYLKAQIQRGNIDFLLKGANQTIDRKLSLATQRAISNSNTTKGEQAIFEPETIQDANTPEE